MARARLRLLACGLLLWLAAGCGPDAKESVVVYSSVDDHYARPVLLDWGKAAGVHVLDRYDSEADKTTGLYFRLREERPRPQADVFWNSEALRTVLLAREGALAVYRSPAAEGLPAWARDPAGRWTGFGARARVLIYNRDRVPAASAPRSIADLADPRFRGRAALALPLFGTTATHAGALRAVLGKEAMEDLFRRYRENGVKIVNGNSAVRDLVAAGDADL